MSPFLIGGLVFSAIHALNHVVYGKQKAKEIRKGTKACLLGSIPILFTIAYWPIAVPLIGAGLLMYNAKGSSEPAGLKKALRDNMPRTTSALNDLVNLFKEENKK